MTHNFHFLKEGRLFAAAVLGAFALAAAGCNEADPPSVAASETSLNLDFKAQSAKVEVTSNYPWTAEITPESACSWCSLSSTSARGAQPVEVYVEANLSTEAQPAEERHALIVFRTANEDAAAFATVHVTQGIREVWK